ncbi:class I SAM-dependent methyltransferase [Rubrivirga sp.]|uniref:class I SAM-dependent methyltransferase n=1 Tax=Rubrivirga sp. TaxID=1885344 RepID=UPI003B52FAC7
MPASVLPLRLGLGLLRVGQPALPGPAGDALRRASRLRLTPAEASAEAAIDALRRELRRSPATVEVVDYGAGTRGDKPPVRRVAEVYRRAATGPAWGRFLFGLARGLRPRRVLELGTNLGVGAAHLAAALALNEAEGGPAGRLVTLEGAPALAALAAGHLERLGHRVGDDGRVRIGVGPFAETLPEVAAPEAWDLVFVDGHHQADAALGYLDTIRPHLAGGALVVLDDVEPGRPVRRAYRALRDRGPSFYAGKYGLLVHAAPGDLGGATTAAARVSALLPTSAGAA